MIKQLVKHVLQKAFMRTAAAVLCCCLCTQASYAQGGQMLTPGIHGNYEIPLHSSGVISLNRAANRVSVGNPEIADIQVFHVNEVYVVAKSIGATNVILWDKNGEMFDNLNISVTHDLSTLKYKLHQLFPSDRIKVQSAQGKIVLSGTIGNAAKMQAVLGLASSFIPACAASQSDVSQGEKDCEKNHIVNLMQIGGAQQVMLEVKVAEINRSIVRKMDGKLNIYNFGSTGGGLVSGGANFPNVETTSGEWIPVFPNLNENGTIGPPADWFNPNTPIIENTGAFLSSLSGSRYLQALIGISKENGLAKILAEPTLTTLSGQQAQFLSGGEFPIPVNSGLGQVTVTFKQFGIGLKFLPVVLGQDVINLKLNVDVSELSSANAATIGVSGTSSTLVVPSLTKRSAQTTVELRDGQTIGIAGLINDTSRGVVNRLPGIGDVPILGTLFKSQEYQTGQTELVIFVTPHLAKPISPGNIRMPTDTFNPPSDVDYYLMGRLENKREPDVVPRPSAIEKPQPQGGLDGGHFGHSL